MCALACANSLSVTWAHCKLLMHSKFLPRRFHTMYLCVCVCMCKKSQDPDQ